MLTAIGTRKIYILNRWIFNFTIYNCQIKDFAKVSRYHGVFLFLLGINWAYDDCWNHGYDSTQIFFNFHSYECHQEGIENACRSRLVYIHALSSTSWEWYFNCLVMASVILYSVCAIIAITSTVSGEEGGTCTACNCQLNNGEILNQLIESKIASGKQPTMYYCWKMLQYIIDIIDYVT
jgi:hypothetical protein